jgi:hypothetical protein
MACLGHELSRTLRVDPEPRFLTPSLKTGLDAAEWVKLQFVDPDKKYFEKSE